MFAAELQVQVATFLALTHAIVGSVALLLHVLQLLAHWAAVQTLVIGVPSVGVVVVRAGDTHGLPACGAVLFKGCARRTLVTHQLPRSFWIIMKVLRRKGFLGGPFNGDVQKLKGEEETGILALYMAACLSKAIIEFKIFLIKDKP